MSSDNLHTHSPPPMLVTLPTTAQAIVIRAIATATRTGAISITAWAMNASTGSTPIAATANSPTTAAGRTTSPTASGIKTNALIITPTPGVAAAPPISTTASATRVIAGTRNTVIITAHGPHSMRAAFTPSAFAAPASTTTMIIHVTAVPTLLGPRCLCLDQTVPKSLRAINASFKHDPRGRGRGRRQRSMNKSVSSLSGAIMLVPIGAKPPSAQRHPRERIRPSAASSAWESTDRTSTKN